MTVITVAQAVKEGVTSSQLKDCATWNDSAAKIAKSRKDTKAAERHIAQAKELRSVAAAVEARQ